MKIHINQLQEGHILSKDLISATKKPLAYKKTVVTPSIKEALQAFLIKEVEVEEYPDQDSRIVKSDANDEVEALGQGDLSLDFYQVYIDAVQSYKYIFNSWQSGVLIDIGKVRQIIIPLVEKSQDHEDEILKLYHYCKQEEYIYHHSISVALLSAFLAKRLGYMQGDINQIALTGLLCDCGMAKVSPTIIQKSVTLTETEYHDIKQHPVHSYNLLKNVMSIKEGVKLGVLQHHERIDGSGYPLGVKGEQLNPYSKIVALADTYQAMVAVRPYRSKQSPFKVFEQMMQDEFGKFDIKVLNALKQALIKFSAGTKVRLSDGFEAEIVFVDEKYPTRPLVKYDHSEEIIILKDRNDLFIEELL
ncbi:HD-GYP domain-containing protein (c-di-GMP phosphodiesterase class II) [Metabacillus crassostreae]|uniref:HD-GYP domain-containing protein n=1 Tax=Metabacillus crassostreae TaxID=929098 RepID=UPI001956D8F7|nr:HD-GYP domain-containing protein [Metabacillus crassostreae]MBM7606739.1 HD-GYP domain-containing protein (c-di-GMP phosphodiesterase class II) [Metabacillus crassostreae]